MPPVPDPANLYSETAAGKLSPAVAGALDRIYVPNRSANSVSVIDPATLKVIDTYKVGVHPQHVVPSWDLKILWVANNAEGRTDGSMTPIDPKTGKPGASIPVDDPYNVYWTPDGRHTIVVAEAFKRLDFRDAKTMKLDYSIETPACPGINHADFSIDGRLAVFTCEFGGAITKIDMVDHRVMETISLSRYFDRPEVLAMLAKPGRKPRHLVDPVKPRSTVIATQPNAPGCAGLARWKNLLCGRHDQPTACTWSNSIRSGRSASSPPAWARTGCTPAATARASTWPTAAATRFAAGLAARAAYR